MRHRAAPKSHARPTGIGGPGVVTDRDRLRRPALSSLKDVPPHGHRDFLRKCNHVRKLLVAMRVAEPSGEVAFAWVLAFLDEADPTFCVREWAESGWRDPLLVDAALRICGTRERAEACMGWLGRDIGQRYDHGAIAELAQAMIDLPVDARRENSA